MNPEPRTPNPVTPRGLGLLVFLAPFCLYFNTMAPTVYGLDSAELTTGAYTLGIIHSPGSPLFLLVGRVFCLLPFGDVGWRVNLVSVVAGALSAFFVYAGMRRVTGRAWIGVATAWLLAASYYVWVWAVVAELYAPHLCIVSALLWLVVKWRDTRRDGLLWTAGIVAGLGMGNHTALVLVGPGLAWLVLASDPTLWRHPRRWRGPGLAALAAFAAVFLYLPIRHAAHPPVDFVRDYFPQINLLSLKGWFWMIRGGMFESLFFSVPQAEIGGHLRRLVAQLLANFGILAAGLSLLGLAVGIAGRHDRRHFVIACALLFLCHSGFYLAYGALDTDWMYSVSYLVVALLVGLGLETMAARVRLPGVIPALAALLVLRLTWFNYPYADLSRDRSARHTGESLLGAMDPGALFVGMWEHVPILEYLQVVEGRRPDVRLVNGVFVGPIGSEQLALDAHRRGIPVYTTFTNLFANGFDFAHLPKGCCYRLTPHSGTAEQAAP
jgi:4-amino-4-deoxy-L-arabinose transferase-like glycosyltransferase